MNTKSTTPNFDPIKKITKAYLQESSPYPKAKAAFNWLNVDFPYMHTHTHWEILIILKGNLYHTINGTKERISKGYAHFIRPTDVHRLDYVDRDTDVEYINFMITNDAVRAIFSLYEDIFDFSNTNAPLFFSLSSAMTDEIVQRALSAQSQSQRLYEQSTLLLIHQLVTVFLFQKLNINDAYPTWLNEFLHDLRNPKCFKMSVEQLAQHTAYSYSHLSRLFKQYMGKTLVEYLNEIKIVYAKRLLRTTSKSILEISLDLGFDSVSSLNHKFKAATSLTPLQYRKKHSNIQRKTSTLS